MRSLQNRSSVQRFLMLGALAVILPGCAKVGVEQFETEVAQLRSEIRQGDEAAEARLGSRIDQMDARLTALSNDMDGLREEYDVTVERLETALRFNVPVHFAFDDATVRAQDREVLDRFAEVVQAHYGDAVITVEGFTDPAGSVAYNRRLGEERASAVRDYLVSAGLGAEQLRVVSYGKAEERLILGSAQGPGEAGWQNRRVSMVIDFAGTADLPRVATPGGGR